MPSPAATGGAGPAPHIELLDAPCVRTAAGTRVALERKDAALLAWLALDGPRLRAEVAAMLWPEVDAAHARNSLRQRLFRLHRNAGGPLVDAGASLRLLPGVTHELDDVAERLAQDPDAPAGELLGTMDYGDSVALADWVDGARQRWRHRRGELLAQQASQHEAKGRIALALRYAHRLLEDELLLEHAHRRVIRLHYLRGDRAAALEAFERCRALLAERLATTPGSETLALARQIGLERPAAAAVVRAPAPVTVQRPPRLVGREAERAHLARVIDARETLVVHGEAGVGKTHLIDDAAASHADLLATTALAGESAVPYSLVARLARAAQQRWAVALEPWVAGELARVAPEFGTAPAARLEPLRLQQALAAALAAWAAAGLAGVAVDDLHHADEASVEALLPLAAARRPRALAWVFGVRSQEMPPALAAWLQTADAAPSLTLALPALDAAAVQALLDALSLPDIDTAAWGPALWRHTGGNPLFVLETVRALLALGAQAPAPDGPLPVPAALHTLLERRLARLPEAALRLARVAALAGTEFDADVAARVLDAHPLDIVEPWRALEEAHVLAGARFTHDLVAETAARTLPQAIAQALHARIATCLESLGRAPARVAHHWARAQAWARAGDTYVAAAREARRASRRSDEVALWQQAAQCLDRAGLADRAFDARADSVEPTMLVAGVQPARDLVQRLAQDEQTEPQRLRRLTAAASVCLMSADAAGGEAAARAALDTATRLGALWPRVAAARLLGVALAQTGRADEAQQAIAPFRDAVEAEGNDEQRGGYWADCAYVLRAGLRMRETADALRRAIACAQASGDSAELATLTSNLATVEGNFGHVGIALDLARRSRALRDPLGDVGGPASGAIDMYVGVYGAGLGRYETALADLDRALACFEHDGQALWRVVCANHKAAVLLQLGQVTRARQALLPPPEMAGVRLRCAVLAARLARALGRRDDGALARAIDELAAQADPYVRMLAQLDTTLSMEPAPAARACASVAAEADALEAQAVALRAQVFRLAHLTRDGGCAFDRALPDALAHALHDAQPADLYPAEAWWVLHRAYLALDDTDRAATMLQRGFDWVAATALPQVPPPFRDSFLQRNEVNRELVAAAGRLLGARLPAALEG